MLLMCCEGKSILACARVAWMSGSKLTILIFAVWAIHVGQGKQYEQLVLCFFYFILGTSHVDQ